MNLCALLHSCCNFERAVFVHTFILIATKHLILVVALNVVFFLIYKVKCIVRALCNGKERILNS